MLLQFICSNHKSIRNEAVFSTLASSDDTYSSRLMEFSGFRILKYAVIYGANGSGKSNFMDAVAFVRNMVINSITHQPGAAVHQVPHRLESVNSESCYEIQFVKNSTRYAYGFTLKLMEITDEYLYCYPNNRQTVIFERCGNSFTEGNRFKGRLSSCRDVLKPNRLLLSCAANFSSVTEIAEVYDFFRTDLVVYNPLNRENWLNYSLYQMAQCPEMKSAVLKFLDELGTGIRDIRIAVDETKLESSLISPFYTQDIRPLLLQNSTDAIKAQVVFDKFETDLMNEESTGIKKLLALLSPIIDTIVNGRVLICDELESGLHESVLFALVRLFADYRSDRFPQLIFTTHETGLLSLDLFRRDQIWFTELRNEDRSTDLYSLAEIRKIRKDDNFEKGYISGKYGAIPMLNLDFAKIIKDLQEFSEHGET